eukprot:TRINITY_DN28422_c0_g1_i1.p1 TRINITY_DN28422_c0_g1~~TRINITY_DN28422_c0_g1_i1.p1  ORF type:complete len:475 (-),score=128.51 TRINITY_DN28422_c0_g1_i1:50-1474(-)
MTASLEAAENRSEIIKPQACAVELALRNGGVGVDHSSKRDSENGMEPDDDLPQAASTGASKGVLFLAGFAVVVDALCPWLQEHVSKEKNFDSSQIVLAEVATYVIGGLALAAVDGGLPGLRQCVNVYRYVSFAPSSCSFMIMNFLTYVAVNGLGASQFFLLVQLRVVVLAVLLRFWRGVYQPMLSWVALVQLVLGMLVLVVLRARKDHEEAMQSALQTSMGPHAAVDSSSASDAAAEDEASLAASISALLGIIFLSAFAFVWMESRLKLNAHEPLHVQVHQLQFSGGFAALCIWLHRLLMREPDREPEQSQLAHAAISALQPPGSSSSSGPLGPAAMLLPTTTPPGVTDDGEDAWTVDLRLCVLFVLLVCRGILTVGVLKKLDSVTKGLIDVMSIVFCALLQIAVDGVEVDWAALGLQAVLLLSISQYFMAKASLTSPSPAASPVSRRGGLTNVSRQVSDYLHAEVKPRKDKGK